MIYEVFKGSKIFLSIVWRDGGGFRVSIRTAWNVARIAYLDK